jgi:alpha 1,3-glucosidase
MRFCNDNIDRSGSSLTTWSIPSYTTTPTVFTSPLLANGKATNATLLISKIKNSGLRIRLNPGPELAAYRYDIEHDDLIVNGTAIRALDSLTVTELASSISIKTTDDLSVILNKSPLSISVQRNSIEYLTINADNFLLLEDGSPAPSETWEGYTETFPHGKTAVGASFQFSNSETKLNGLMESTNGFDLPDVAQERRYALDGYSRYASLPFVFAHNPQFECTSAIFWMNPSDFFYKLQTSKTRDLSILSEGGFIDFLLFVAPVQTILPQYFAVTGLPAFPPAFALGYHQSRYGYPSQKCVEEVIANLSAVNFPHDVQWLDIDHLSNMEPFVMSSTWWTNSGRFFDQAAAAGLAVVRITDPHMWNNRDKYLPFKEAEAKGFLVKYDGADFIAQCWPGSSAWPDFLRSDVRDWWGTLIDRFQFPENCHIWNDMNEVTAWSSLEDTLRKDGVQLSGEIETREVHSIYGLSNAAATHAGLLAKFPRRRPFVLSRSFFAGSQKFAWHWSGDNLPTYDHLRLGLETLLTSNLAGVPFTGSDLGGMNAETNPQLLARWYQLGAYLFPFCREHSTLGTKPREPYLYKDSNPDEFGAMIGAVVDRYRLMPLFYTAARDVSEFGQPYVAPLWYYFPQTQIESNVANHQPIVGGKMMVVPQLTENGKSVQVWKPPGRWFELRNGSGLVSDTDFSTNWEDHVLAFVRGGELVFEFNNHGMRVQETYRQNLTVYVGFNESGESSGSVYFDDLKSMNHLSGDFVRIGVYCNLKRLILKRSGPFVVNNFVERILIYGSTSAPTFAIPGGSVSYADGVACITGVSVSLSEDHDFGPATSEAPNRSHAFSDKVKAIGIVLGCSVGIVLGIGVIAFLRSGRRQTGRTDPTSLVSQESVIN